MTEEESTAKGEMRVSGVDIGEGLLGETESELVCTEDELQYEGEEQSLTITHEDVSEATTEIDQSVAGFSMIGVGFGVTGFLMLFVFVQAVVLGDAPVLSIVGAGSGASGVLSLVGAVWMRQLEVGERLVLRLTLEDGQTRRFIADENHDELSKIEQRIR